MSKTKKPTKKPTKEPTKEPIDYSLTIARVSAVLRLNPFFAQQPDGSFAREHPIGGGKRQCRWRFTSQHLIKEVRYQLDCAGADWGPWTSHRAHYRDVIVEDGFLTARWK